MGTKIQEKIATYVIYGWPLNTKKMNEGKSSRNTDTNIKLGLIFRSISARLVTCTSTCPIIQYGLFGGITFEKIISDWIHVIWLFPCSSQLSCTYCSKSDTSNPLQKKRANSEVNLAFQMVCISSIHIYVQGMQEFLPFTRSDPPPSSFSGLWFFVPSFVPVHPIQHD